MKVISWLMLNGASVLGIAQSAVKAIKEVVTAIVNLISLFMTAEQAEVSVATVRKGLNIIDNVLENIKNFLIK